MFFIQFNMIRCDFLNTFYRNKKDEIDYGEIQDFCKQIVFLIFTASLT